MDLSSKGRLLKTALISYSVGKVQCPYSCVLPLPDTYSQVSQVYLISLLLNIACNSVLDYQRISIN